MVGARCADRSRIFDEVAPSSCSEPEGIFFLGAVVSVDAEVSCSFVARFLSGCNHSMVSMLLMLPRLRPCDRRENSFEPASNHFSLSFPRIRCRYSSRLPVSVLRTALALCLMVERGERRKKAIVLGADPSVLSSLTRTMIGA